MEIVSEPLVKIVPAGEGVHSKSPYFAKLSEYEDAIAKGHNLSERFGLPIKSEAQIYDVYDIRPNGPTEVFVTRIAPTSELDGKITKPGGATQYLVPNRGLFTEATRIASIGNDLALHTELVVAKGLGTPITAIAESDPARGLNPKMLRGMAVVGAAASVVDAGVTGKRAWELYQQDNAVGAQSQVMRFGARNVGGWTGAVVGAEIGAALGVESGPGAVLTGIAGAGIGAWGASKVVDWAEQHRINTQTDRQGNTWQFDPKQPDQGWTREVMDAFVERGPSITHTEVANPAVANELNYKASSMAVQLRLATPDIPVDPNRIAADASDSPRSLRESTWTRNPETRQWTRKVADGLIDRTMHVTPQTADPQKAAELDAYAQTTNAYNAARTPAAIALRYEQTYAQSGWAQYGPVPEAVTQTREQVQSPQPTASTLRMRGPGKSSQSDDTTVDADRPRSNQGQVIPAQDSEAPQIPNPVQTHRPRDPRDRDHPDHAMNQGVRDQVKALYAEHGVTLSDQQLEQTTACVMKDARVSGMTSVAQLGFSENYATGKPDVNGNIFAYAGDPMHPATKWSATDTQQAAQTQPDAAYRQFEQTTQQQTQFMAQFQEQQRQLDNPNRSGPTHTM